MEEEEDEEVLVLPSTAGKRKPAFIVSHAHPGKQYIMIHGRTL